MCYLLLGVGVFVGLAGFVVAGVLLAKAVLKDH
jgi:hypothetical protein